MNSKCIRLLGLCAVVLLLASLQVPAQAQTQMINARISGNGNGNGKCTFEVVVQGRAEVQIRGNQGRLVTESGAPATWRRLDCNQALPPNPANFKFSGVDGHGKQSLGTNPDANNGVAVILIDNGNRGNNEGYTGDITWSGGGSWSNNGNQGWGNGNRGGHDNGYWGNNGNGGWNNNSGEWNGNNNSAWNNNGRWGNGAGQPQDITAKLSGKGGSGKCTFEVVVQGRAEVQIRGNEGRLITDSGAPATWRRLDCNQPLPPNPANFHFAGVDGHGHQNLVADPNSNGGVAVIQIDNGNRGNNEGYTGDIMWR